MPSSEIHKSQMSVNERRLRSQLTQMIQRSGVIRGTLSERAVTCGKSNCKCARGEKHSYLYIVASEGGKLRQRSIPKNMHGQVRRWIENYQQMQQVIEELSQLHWIMVEKREK